MSSADSGTEWILAAGRLAGLSDCGIASCAPSEHGEYLDAWIAEGAQGAMAWMTRSAEIRKNLRSKWTWARSALVGVLDYLTEPRDREDLGGLARHLSRYARGADYHDLLKQRLAGWAEALEQDLGRSFRHALLVDTSAVLERELALRAGLGWIGRNTCLIGPRGNSWRFIGVLLTDLELPAAARRLPERCGSCRACLDACPTAALPRPHFVDATRCISYLTIEHRGSIPVELREGMGDWLFGCDICQEVCPWNRRVEAGGAAEFRVDPRYEELSLADLVGLDESAFRERFRKTPLARPKRVGLVRNALIVGANLGDPAVLKAARKLLEDPEESLRETARWVSDRDLDG